MMNYKEVVILIAEDDDGHAELIIEALQESGIKNTIIRFSDGEEIWNFLTGDDKNNIKDDEHSYLVLLDINMPILSGVEVLQKMRDNEELKNIPVIMLTTTDDPREVEACYKIGCNFYITKPVDFIRFTETLKRLGLFVQIIKI